MTIPPPDVWRIEFYADEDGSFPVRSWLEIVPDEVRGKVLARIELLKTGGPTLDFPYTSQIEGKLREARLSVGKTRYRVLYSSTKTAPPFYCMASPKPLPLLRKSTKRLGEPGWRGTSLN